MKKIYLLSLVALMFSACSNGGGGSSSGGSSTDNPQTYGGVNLPSASNYTFHNGDGSMSGMLRLVNESSGIIYIASTSTTLPFNLVGSVSAFNSSVAQCLPATTLTGSINNVNTTTATVSFKNCNITDSVLSADISIAQNDSIIYSGSVGGQEESAISAAAITQFADTLGSDAPAAYNYNTNIPVNFTVSSVLGTSSGATGVYGTLLGNLFLQLTSTIPQTFDYGGITGQAIYNVIDSSSLNITLNNLEIESSLWGTALMVTNNAAKIVGQSGSNQLLCNVIMSGLENNKVRAYITGCSGTISTPLGNSAVTLNGNFEVK